MVWRTAIIATLGLALCGCGRDTCDRGPFPISALKSADRDAVKVTMPWWKDARTCKVAGYIVSGPYNAQPAVLAVTSESGVKIFIESPGSVGAMTPKGNLIRFEIDKAGALASISYSVVSSDGKEATVYDLNADGIPDTKISNDGAFVNLGGEWAKFERRNGVPGALIAGGWHELVQTNHIWGLAGSP